MKKIVAIILVIASLISAMGLAVYAKKGKDRFHDSVEAQHHPEIVPKPQIVTPTGEIEIPDGELIITPYAKADEAKYKEITDSLHGAYNSILNAESLKDLHPDLEKEVKKFGDKYTVEDLVARMMFNVYVTGTYRDYLEADERNYIKVTFNLGLNSKSRTPIMMVTPDGKVWDLNQADFVTRNADNTITVKIYDIGTVAFFYLTEDSHNINTGDIFMMLLLVLFIMGMLVTGTALIVSGKRKQKIN